MVSPLSSPSEGEIVESDSDKATTAPTLHIGTSVDRPSRTLASVSKSPSRSRSPRRHKSRSESRSPYRESRGAKRSLDDDHYDRIRNDPRRFQVRYEDYSAGERSRIHGLYNEGGRSVDRIHRQEGRDANERARESRTRTRSRSPSNKKATQLDHERYTGRFRGGRVTRDTGSERVEKGYRESRSKLSIEQSVRDRGHSSIAAAKVIQDAEFQTHQTNHVDGYSGRSNQATAKYASPPFHPQSTDRPKSSIVRPAAINAGEVPPITQPVDEATQIEERRKKREAIKAKYRGQATPLLVQALAIDNNPAPSTPTPQSLDEEHPVPGKSSSPATDAY